MSCNSDHMMPTPEEQRLQHAAQLLVYVRKKLGQKPESWALREAKNLYAANKKSVPLLCSILRAMDPDTREALVYNAHDRMARRLADWWEDHQAADARRAKQAVTRKKEIKTRKKALEKLTPKERRALNLTKE